MNILTIEQAEEMGLNGDIFDLYYEAAEEDENPRIIEATAQELADMGAGTLCGSDQQDPFKHVAAIYPGLKVRTCLIDRYDGIVAGCCDIEVESQEQADKVSELVSDGGGSLRNDFCAPGWAYFETE